MREYKLKLDLKIDCTSISQLLSTKFLKFIINETLTWNNHIKTIYNKISRSIGIICKGSVNLQKI